VNNTETKSNLSFVTFTIFCEVLLRVQLLLLFPTQNLCPHVGARCFAYPLCSSVSRVWR